MMSSPSTVNRVTMIKVIHCVHRQPRYDDVTNPPKIGPATGPIKVAAANMATATPLSTGPQKSARAPPTIASGAQPNTPPKKRVIMMVSTFVATATGICKMPITIYPVNSGIVRP